MFISFSGDHLQNIEDLLDELRDLEIKVPKQVLEELENLDEKLVWAKKKLKDLKTEGNP